ncbi:protein DEEPER ROOTING 1-like [Prosopis cineraria]|nr:protein DEEPER ROOTING 1-like [Prosopis cineraria]
MFVCRSNLQRTHFFKDPLSTESRMEKIFRAILNKKIHPHGSSSTMVLKKHLKDKQMTKSDNDDDEFNNPAADNGSKWVKTDSEYIVLEI